MARDNFTGKSGVGGGNFTLPAVSQCDRENDEVEISTALLLQVLVVMYMFYGLAHVCEDFLVPALEIMCEKHNIPEDVAGATLLAAGCNAPELFTSIIGGNRLWIAS